MFSQWKILNFNQIIALGLMAWGSWRLAHIIPSPLSEWIIEIGDRVADMVESVYNSLEKQIRVYSKKGSKYLLSIKKRIKK